MSRNDLDMAGEVVDRAMERVSKNLIAHRFDPSSYAGHWLDRQAREVHVAFAGSTSAEFDPDLQIEIPDGVHVVVHQFRHALAELEALQQTVDIYLQRENLWQRYAVDLGVQIKANVVRIRLKHETPASVVQAVRSQFHGAPLEVALTKSHWTAQ